MRGGPSARCSSRSRNGGNCSTPREDLIMIMNSRGHIVQISPSCETMLGYKPEEMIGRSGVDFIHPAHLDQSREEMRALRRGGHPKLADTRCIPQGRPRGLAVLARQLVGSGQALLLRRARHDRGEARRRSPCATASSSRATSSRPRSTPSSRPTRRSTILNWSSRAEELFGWRRDEALGQERGRSDRRRERAREGQGRASRASSSRQTARRSTAAASSWSAVATARSSRPS